MQVPPANNRMSQYPALPEQDRKVPNMFDPKGGDLTLSNNQAWANNPEFKKRYPASAAMMGYQHPWTSDNTLSHKAGDWLRQNGPGMIPQGLKNLANSGPVGGAISYGLPAAAAGAVAGYGAGALRNFMNPGEESSPGGTSMLWALLGGLGAAGLGAYSGYLKNTANYNNFTAPPNPLTKAAAFIADPSVQIAGFLQQATGMSFYQKQQLLDKAEDLPASQQRELVRLLATAGGAGVGAIVANYVAGKSLMAAAAGAVLGGLITSKVMNQTPKNAFGQSVLQKTDFYGNRFK